MARSRKMLQIDGLKKAEVREWGEDIEFGGVLAEEFDGADTVGVEDVVDVMREIVADGCGRDGDARRPLFDKLFNVQKAVVARGFEIFDELRSGQVDEGLWADGPDGGDPGDVGADTPLVGEVEPLARSYGLLDYFAGFQGQECRISNKDGGVRSLQHRDRIG